MCGQAIWALLESLFKPGPAPRSMGDSCTLLDQRRERISIETESIYYALNTIQDLARIP
jgi:hypothetical protein